jgi:membrane-associated phospholipid phosphatase
MYPYDWMIVIFCTVMAGAIFVFGRPITKYTYQLGFFIGVFILTLVIVRYVDERRGRLQAFVRLLYPAVLFSFFYNAMGGLILLIHGEYLDWQLTAFEKMLYGVHPTLYIDANLLHVWLNELFSLGYFSYYFMVGGILLVLYVGRHYDRIKFVLSALCLAFFISFVIFVLYPIEGPRWYFANQYMHTVEGPVFRQLVEFVINNGAFRGGCMPSSHVAVALTVLFACFRYYPRTARAVVLPLNVLLAIGTVWGRFHYLTDVFVGIAIAVFVDRLIVKYFDRWLPLPYKVRIPTEMTKEHAS